jgi:seryl-tRNA synthetase
LIEKSGYLSSFPHLLGCVSCLGSDEGELTAAVSRAVAGLEWSDGLKASDIVLAPAACYPVYPLAAERPIPEEGRVFDVASECYRHEPSRAIDRFRSFRMREFVVIGYPAQVREFRKDWMSRAGDFAEALELPHRIEIASDPFFGRPGVLVANAQMQQELKFELLAPVRSPEQPTACVSFNYHRDHFAGTWGLRLESGESAHTACVAFGLDRLAVALFAIHGLDQSAWPASVCEFLAF